MTLPGETLQYHKRKTIPGLSPEAKALGDTAFEIGLRVWEILVDLEHRGLLLEASRVSRAVGRVISTGFYGKSWRPFADAVVADYLKRTAKTRRGLRKKSASRLGSVPLAGPLAALLPAQVVSARLCRSGSTYVIKAVFTVERECPDPLKRLERVYHCQDVEDIGLAATPTGLDIVVINRRKPRKAGSRYGTADLRVLREDRGSVKTYHVDYKKLLRPGFIQELYRHVIAPKANTVALDVSMLPNVTGNGRHAISQLNRLLRARKVEGTIEFRKVSPMGEDIQDTLRFAASSGLRSSQIELLRQMCVLKCSHCGAPTPVGLDPETLTPMQQLQTCACCQEVVSTGSLLATRASVYAHYAFFEHVLRFKPRPDRIDSDRPVRHRRQLRKTIAKLEPRGAVTSESRTKNPQPTPTPTPTQKRSDVKGTARVQPSLTLVHRSLNAPRH